MINFSESRVVLTTKESEVLLEMIRIEVSRHRLSRLFVVGSLREIRDSLDREWWLLNLAEKVNDMTERPQPDF